MPAKLSERPSGRRSAGRRSAATAAAKRWKSRAVLRSIEAGSDAYCACCGERVKFQAKVKSQQVICNVYVRGTWDRVEHYHSECYHRAGEPYGAAAA